MFGEKAEILVVKTNTSNFKEVGSRSWQYGIFLGCWQMCDDVMSSKCVCSDEEKYVSKRKRVRNISLVLFNCAKMLAPF